MAPRDPRAYILPITRPVFLDSVLFIARLVTIGETTPTKRLGKKNRLDETKRISATTSNSLEFAKSLNKSVAGSIKILVTDAKISAIPIRRLCFFSDGMRWVKKPPSQ